MSNSFKDQTRHVLKVAVAFVPWIISMYTLYWLDYGQIWTTETPHRGKASVAILVLGMGLSFFVHSYFTERKQD
jgi:hypothetical protein